MEPVVNVLVVWIRGQTPRGRVAGVVVSKDKAAVRRHIVVGIFELDDAGAQLKIFLEVKYCSIGIRC